MSVLPESLGSSATTTLDKLSRSFKDGRRTSEDRIRNAPLPSVLGALGIGYLLRFLPITAILFGVVRLVLALIKPAIIAFGAFKLYEFLRTNAADNIAGKEPERVSTPEPAPLDEAVGV
jgi:hypothetical protein